jgi:DDE domain
MAGPVSIREQISGLVSRHARDEARIGIETGAMTPWLVHELTPPGDSPSLSELDGRMVYLWRAVDAEGEVLDVLVQAKRNKRAALKLMRKLLKKYGFCPEKLMTDDLRSYSAAAHDLGDLAPPRARSMAQQSSREIASANTKGTEDA